MSLAVGLVDSQQVQVCHTTSRIIPDDVCQRSVSP